MSEHDWPSEDSFTAEYVATRLREIAVESGLLPPTKALLRRAATLCEEAERLRDVGEELIRLRAMEARAQENADFERRVSVQGVARYILEGAPEPPLPLCSELP